VADLVDFAALSRDVARVFERVTKGFADPFGDQRHVATQSTYRALADAKPPGGWAGATDEALVRDALLRWVHELLQRRVGGELASDEEEAVSRVDDRFAHDPPGTFAEARRALVFASNPMLATTALARLADLAPPVAAVRKEQRARRFEAATRLGLEHPLALAGDVSQRTMLAKALLDATEGIAEDLRRRARLLGASSALTLHHVLARSANHGWPAHLGARWLDDAFAALVVRPFECGPLPAAIGGASFLRAAFVWGHSLRLAGTARALPFVLARDPYPRDAYRFGALLATAVGDPIFQKKRLGLSARVAAAQARALRETLLHETRLHAMRFLVALPSNVDPGTFDELSVRVFGAPLPPALRFAWPEPRICELARLDAVLLAHGFARDLVERFDEDWFANPKTGAHLAAIAAGPVFTEHPLDEKVPSSIGRAFERALG
jgi:hypothetical protein